MRSKKSRRQFQPAVDDRRPSKVEAESELLEAGEHPTYRGVEKTDGPHTRGRGKAKSEFVAEQVKRPRAPKRQPELPDMQPPRRRRRTVEGAVNEQYVRLRIRVRDGRLSVVDSSLVDGPLTQVNAFAGSNAYEVTLGDRLLHAGALPDLGVQRSFVDPADSEGRRTHHITDREVFEFYARVPAHELSPETIGEVAVRLHRVKGEPRADNLRGARLDVQFEREMRPVAELRGLPEAVLPQEIERRGGRTPNA